MRPPRRGTLVRSIRKLAILHPEHGKRTVSRKSADAIAPRAQVLCANDSCAAGEFSTRTPNEGNSGELLPRICSTVRTAGIARRECRGRGYLVVGKCGVTELTLGNREGGACLPDPANPLFEADCERFPRSRAARARYENCLARTADRMRRRRAFR